MLGSLAATGVYFPQQPLMGSLHGAKPQLLCMIPPVLGLQLSLRLHLHQWPHLTSHSAKPQLLSMTPSHLQNQDHLGDTHYQVQLPTQDTTMATAETELLCALRKCFPEDFTSVMPVAS